MTSFKLALLNLVRRRFPTLATVLSIAVAVACSGILLRLNKLSESRFSSMGHGGDAIVGAKAGGIEILLGALNGEGAYPDFLPYKLFETLRSEQKVQFEDGAASQPSFIESIIPLVYFGKFHDFRIIGTDESFLKRPEPEESLHLTEGHWAQQPGEIVLGSQVADREKLKVGDKIRAQTWIGREQNPPLELTVTGILTATQTTWDRMLYSNLEEAQNVFRGAEASLREKSIWGPQVLNYFLFYLKPGGFSQLENLINKRTVGEAILISKEKEKLQELSGAGQSIGLFVSILIILLGSLSVCSMLLTRFDGMTVQLAVLRALGYTKTEITQWLLWEGFLLGVSGCILGALLDTLGFPALREILGSALPPADLVSVSIFESYPVWVMALLTIVLAIFIPLIRLYRQNIHNALRGV